MKYGLGLRPTHYETILSAKPPVDFFEALSEDYIDLSGYDFSQLQKIRAHYPIVLHGVGLSIGGSDPLNKTYLKALKKLIDVINPLWISDHFCWTGIDHINTHDLLPLPYTEEAISHVVSRINTVQDFLGRQLLFENVSSYAAFTVSEMTEWDFISEIARRSDCYILLDVNNVYVNSVNHCFNPVDFINAIAQDRVKQFHLSGHKHCGTHIIDTHDDAIVKAVWDLYRKANLLFPNTPLIIERDANIPPIGELLEELNYAKAIHDEFSHLLMRA